MTGSSSIASTTEFEPEPETGDEPGPGDDKRRRTPRKIAMDYLARREHSQAELRAKLVAKGIDSGEAEATVSRLAEQGLVSDERFAEAFTTARARKGHGPVRLRLELEQRDVAAELIDTALVRAEVDWVESACTVREKKYGAAVPADFSERAKQMKFLQYRGFTAEQIERALSNDS